MHIIFWLVSLKRRELGRSRRIWEDNIRMDLRKTVWKDVERMHGA
jgi:hypothetical protein